MTFFANSTADPSGYGEGQTYLGSATVTTDANGNATFQVTFKAAVPVGQVISATATDPIGNTSEFAKDVTVAAPASPPSAAPGVVRTAPSFGASGGTSLAAGVLDEPALDVVAADVARARRRYPRPTN